jgi:hypothetical protein
MAEWFEVVGAREAIANYERRARHALDPAPGMQKVFPVMEADERAIFGEYGGKYVDTGALKASLTQPEATDALREAHGEEAIFGSKVWYGIFQGTTGTGLHGPPSAILKMSDEVAHGAAAEAVARYIVSGGVEDTLISLAAL